MSPRSCRSRHRSRHPGRAKRRARAGRGGRHRGRSAIAASAAAPVTAYAAAAPPWHRPRADSGRARGPRSVAVRSPVAATPALTAWTGQVPDPEPAAVVGTAPAAGAPAESEVARTADQRRHRRSGGPVPPGDPGAFIGDTVPADWYFPTQADGSVQPQGLIWLQHGFAATNTFYSALATELAQKTNSVVVAPTLSSIPFTFSGGWLNGPATQSRRQALLDPERTVLIDSARRPDTPVTSTC